MKHLNKQAVRQNKACQHTSQSTDNRLYIGRGFAQWSLILFDECACQFRLQRACAYTHSMARSMANTQLLWKVEMENWQMSDLYFLTVVYTLQLWYALWNTVNSHKTGQADLADAW